MGIFPHLLWSKAVLFGMLNALQTLSLSVHDEDTQEVKVGRMRRRVILMETCESRQDLLHEFAQRSKEFVKTSVEWAPDTVQSHLQEYINTVRIGHRIHAGVTLATECIQSFSMGGMTNTGPNARRRNVQVHSCPKTIYILYQTRANEICFMDVFSRQIVYTICTQLSISMF